MKRTISLIIFLLLIILLWQCSEKDAIDISGFTPNQPAESPGISRTELKTVNNSFLPGYQSGKILSDRITLNWQQTNIGDFQSYRLIRDNLVIGIFKEATITSFTDSNLIGDQFYNYKIGVINQRGIPKVDTIRLKTPKFFGPSNLIATVSQDSVTLNWTNQAELGINFRIYRRFNFGEFQVIGTSATENFLDTGLSTGNYGYRVTAYFNSLEETSPSNVRNVFIP